MSLSSCCEVSGLCLLSHHEAARCVQALPENHLSYGQGLLHPADQLAGQPAEGCGACRQSQPGQCPKSCRLQQICSERVLLT